MKKIKKDFNFGKAFLLKGLYCLVFILLRYEDSFGQTPVSISPSNTSTVYYKLSTEDVYSDNSDIVGSIFYDGTYRWYRKAFLFDLSQIPSYAYVTQCQIVFSASVYQGSNPGSCNFALLSTDFINWSDYDIWDDINSHTPNTSQWVGGLLTEYKISSNFEGAVQDAVSNSPHELPHWA